MGMTKIFKVNIPDWLRVLDAETPVIAHAIEGAKKLGGKTKKGATAAEATVANLEKLFHDSPYFKALAQVGEPVDGVVNYELVPHEDLFNRVMSDVTGAKIQSQGDLTAYVASVADANKKYENMAAAIAQMEETGYGVVTPAYSSYELERPQLFHSGKNFGVKLRANAHSVHLIRVDVRSEVAPIIGSEEQSKEMLKYLTAEYDTNRAALWETPIFGKSLESITREDISQKSASMPVLAKQKMQRTLSKIASTGHGGVVCILL